MTKRFEAVSAKLAGVEEQIRERTAKRGNIRIFMGSLKNHNGLVSAFSEELWYSMVDTVTVHAGKRLRFRFREGTEVEVGPDIWKTA